MKLTGGTSGTQTCKKQNGWQVEIDIYSIEERRLSLVRFQEHQDNLSQKMKIEWEGPFVITEVLGPVTYRLKLPTSWQIHNVFHAMLLKPYSENEIYGENFTEPPPELVEGEEVYKSRLFVVTGNRNEDINIMSNGRVILFLTPHGNQNMHFPMMVKYWLTTKNATTFNFSFVSI